MNPSLGERMQMLNIASREELINSPTYISLFDGWPRQDYIASFIQGPMNLTMKLSVAQKIFEESA